MPKTKQLGFIAMMKRKAISTPLEKLLKDLQANLREQNCTLQESHADVIKARNALSSAEADVERAQCRIINLEGEIADLEKRLGDEGAPEAA
jgi:chromosome segregation ATPase